MGSDTNCSTPVSNGIRIVRAVTQKNIPNDRGVASRIENIDENNTSQYEGERKYFFISIRLLIIICF